MTDSRSQPSNEHDDLDVADQVKVMAWNAVAQKNEQITALKARITKLEGALRQIRDFPYVGRQAEQARVGIARATLDEPKAGS